MQLEHVKAAVTGGVSGLGLATVQHILANGGQAVSLKQVLVPGRVTIVDFYADWCVSCKEMEKYTFTDKSVQDTLANTVLLQADVTANDEQDQELLQRFGVFGPPTIIFFGTDGQQRHGYEVVGYMKAEAFAEHVLKALAAAAVTASTGTR